MGTGLTKISNKIHNDFILNIIKTVFDLICYVVSHKTNIAVIVNIILMFKQTKSADFICLLVDFTL